MNTLKALKRYLELRGWTETEENRWSINSTWTIEATLGLALLTTYYGLGNYAYWFGTDLHHDKGFKFMTKFPRIYKSIYFEGEL